MKRIMLIEIVELGNRNPEPVYSNVLEHETKTPAHITQVLQELFDMVMEELKHEEM